MTTSLPSPIQLILLLSLHLRLCFSPPLLSLASSSPLSSPHPKPFGHPSSLPHPLNPPAPYPYSTHLLLVNPSCFSSASSSSSFVVLPLRPVSLLVHAQSIFSLSNPPLSSPFPHLPFIQVPSFPLTHLPFIPPIFPPYPPLLSLPLPHHPSPLNHTPISPNPLTSNPYPFIHPPTPPQSPTPLNPLPPTPWENTSLSLQSCKAYDRFPLCQARLEALSRFL